MSILPKISITFCGLISKKDKVVSKYDCALGKKKKEDGQVFLLIRILLLLAGFKIVYLFFCKIAPFADFKLFKLDLTDRYAC